MLILIDVPLYISVMHPMPNSKHPTTVSVKYLFGEANIA